MVVPDDIRPASDPANPPPYDSTEVALSDWPAEWRKAWSVFQNAELGDTVLWGDRAQPLVVQRVTETDEGYTNVVVEGPRGGQYTLRERYDEETGEPQYWSDDSRAMDLRFIEREQGEERGEFSAQMYEGLVRNLKRAAVNTYVEKDYSTWGAAVDAVVQSWAESVSFQRWRGWPYEWEADTSEYIFRQVVEHSGEFPDTNINQPQTPKVQATQILQIAVREAGRELAMEKLITSQEDYDAWVEQLAADAVERDDRAAHLDARQAGQEVVEEFIEAHGPPVYRAILQYGYAEPDEPEMYAAMDETASPAQRYDGDTDEYDEVERQNYVLREMAFDVLDEDVWQEARGTHEERGTHDPTVRGLAFYEYDDLVEVLTEETLREHRINDNRMLYTTARQTVREFADATEAHEWPYEFGGPSEGAWGAGDVEDLFTSIVMHSEVDPQVFNPFARDKERKMAVQVLTEVVHQRASDAKDSSELAEAEPIPANQYLDEQLGMDLTFNDIRDDVDLSPEAFIRQAVEGMAGDGGEHLAGWTFVDELVQEAEATVPYVAGPWVLVDYGLVQDNDTHRSLAWFNRNNGAVLSLSGTVTNPPQEGAYEYESFHVALIEWGADQPRYLLSDASLGEAFRFARSFVDADAADINVIETADGEHYIQEAITDDDLDVRPFVGGVAPSFSMPGPGFSPDDVLAYGGEAFRRLGGYLRDNSKLVDTVTRTSVALFMGEISYLMYRVAPGLNVEPDYHQKYGVGVKATYNFGQESDDLDTYDPKDPDSYPFTGRLDGTVRITPGAFKMLADTYSPNWLYQAGPDATVLNTMRETIERPLRDQTGDFFQRERAVFLGAHLPPEPRGRPDGADEYAENVPINTVHGGESVDQQAKYTEPVGEHRDTEEVRDLLWKATQHGYVARKSGDDRTGSNRWFTWGGDENVRDRIDVERDNTFMIGPAEIHEIGWAMVRDHLWAPTTTARGAEPKLIGSEEEVARTWDGTEPDGPVATYRTFRRLFREFEGTPNHAMLNTVWTFYKERARDAEEFTLIDAFDRFRMGLVYDAAMEETTETTMAILRDSVRDRRALERVKRPEDRYYLWNLTGPLAANRAWSFDEASNTLGTFIPDIFVFPAGNTPPDDVEYIYRDEEREGSLYWRHYVDRDDEPVDGPGGRQYILNSLHDLHTTALTASAQSEIANRVAHDELSVRADVETIEDPDELPIEERRWRESDEADRVQRIAAGQVRWDDLDGTDLSVFGLFLRGMDMETAAQLADNWNLNDRFSTRLSNVLPSTLEPARPDIPSFEEWLERRRGRNAIGSVTDRARQKATYMREMANTIPGVQSGEATGTDPTVEEEIEQMRDLQEHYEDTDYEAMSQFYADEFGESFEDVAQKFTQQRPRGRVNQQPSDIIEGAPQPPEGPQGVSLEEETNVANDQDDSDPTPDPETADTDNDGQ